MGVETKFFIMPETSGYRPEPSELIALIRSLISAAFLSDPGESSSKFTWRIGRDKGEGNLGEMHDRLIQHPESDLLIKWSIHSLVASGLCYPLSDLPELDDVYYDIEIHRSALTLYHTSEIIEPFDGLYCSCGAELSEIDAPSNDLYYCSRLPLSCSACNSPVDFAKFPMCLRDGWTGAESQAYGGVTYRFAIVVDCGKCWPDKGAQVNPKLINIIQQAIGKGLRIVQDLY